MQFKDQERVILNRVNSRHADIKIVLKIIKIKTTFEDYK